MAKSYPPVRVPASREPVSVTVRLNPDVAACLNVIRLADCAAWESEPVPLEIFLSWWICREVSGSLGSGGRYEDMYCNEHSCPRARYIPGQTEGGPGDFIDGVPWWMVTSAARRRAKLRPSLNLESHT